MKKLKMTPGQETILEAVVEHTRKLHGKDAGELKNVLSYDVYDGRTMNALFNRGVVDFLINTEYGTGWVATMNGYEWYKNHKKG